MCRRSVVIRRRRGERVFVSKMMMMCDVLWRKFSFLKSKKVRERNTFLSFSEEEEREEREEGAKNE